MKIPQQLLGLIALVAAHPHPGPITTGPIMGTAVTAMDCGGNPCSDSVSAVPTCAVGCLESAATVVSCATTDYQCMCSASDGIQSAAQSCVLDSCGLATALQAVSSVQAVCSCVTASPTTKCPPTDKRQEPTTESTTNNNPTSIPSSITTIPVTSPPTTSTSTTAPPKESDMPGGVGGGTPSTTTTTTVPTNPASCAGRDCGAVATTAIPSCAQQCFAGAAPSVGCGVADYACQCAPQAQSSLSMIVGTCVMAACQPGDLDSVLAGASSVCACATAPPDGSCTTPSAPGGTGPSTQPTITVTPNKPTGPPTGSGTGPEFSWPTTSGGGWFSGMPGGGGPSPGGGRRVGEPGGGFEEGGGFSGTIASSFTGSGSVPSASFISASESGSGFNMESGSGFSTDSGPGFSSGADGNGAGQTVPTTQAQPTTPVTAGASGNYGLGLTVSVACAVLAAALAL